MTGAIDFSTDASSNDVAAPPIDWREGMPANGVNNSARETLAAIARYLSDNGGGLGASGAASNRLRLSTTQGLTTANMGRAITLSFQVDDANTGPCTLNVDNTGDRLLRRPGNFDLAPGDLQSGVPYKVIWLPNLGTYTIIAPQLGRPGQIAAFGAENSIPPGWVPCDGRTLSRASYVALFNTIFGAYGTPDANTFQVPDLRGRAPFGADGGTGRLTGAGGLGGGLGTAGGSETVALSVAQLASHSHGGSTGGAGGHDHGGSTGGAGGHDHGGSTGGAGRHSHTGTTGGGGGHSHSGSTSSAGEHSHSIRYQRLASYRTDSQSGGVDYLDSGNNQNNTSAITNGSGSHTHSLTIENAPDHTHNLTTNDASDHGHGIAGVGDHSHAVGGVPDHTHALSISSAGDGAGHPNVPPGLVVTFAIKA